MGKIYNVLDFGANNKDCSFDNADILRDVFQKAGQTNEHVEIVFPYGTYAVENVCPNSRFILEMNKIKNISLKGNGSLILVKNPLAGVFRFNSSSDISIEGFEIKYETAPWTQGEITNVDKEKGIITYTAEADYDLFSDPRMENFPPSFGVVVENEYPHRLICDGPEHMYLKTIEKIAPYTYNITLREKEHITNDRIKKHNKMLYLNRTMSGSVIGIFRSKNITVKDMLVHESGDCLFVGAYIDGDVIIDNYRTKLDGNNYAVSNADGVHIQGLRGKLTMKNCYFEGLMDDCVNLYHFPGIVKDVISENRFRVFQAEHNLPRKGETMMFFNPDTEDEKFSATVLDVESINDSSDECIVVLDNSVIDIKPEVGDTFFIEEAMASGTVIVNNHFANCRRYGLLLKSKNTLIENNTFEHLGGDAINFTANSSNKSEREGPYACNITIKDNIIKDVCYLDTRKQKTPWASGGAIGIYKNNQNIDMINNTFTDIPCAKVSFADKNIFIK